MGGCSETQGGGGAVDAGGGRHEEAPPHPRGAGADHRADEAAVGGAEEGAKAAGKPAAARGQGGKATAPMAEAAL